MADDKYPTKRCGSYEELEKVSLEYDLSLTPEQRLDAAQFLREQYFLINKLQHRRINKSITRKGNYNED